MAEVARCDAQSADRAKADFISSISHELRSPLHGILGSVEFLQDTFVDAFQENLIYIVETCGKTLLDTMDHLLDFAKINNFTRIKDKRDSEGETRRRSPGGHVLDGTVDLSVVTEEVLETVFAGYDYQRTAAPKERDKGSKEDDATGYTVSFRGDQQGPPKDSGVNGGEICVIVDIDRASDSHWTFNTQAGAWRRILMNVVGNALKYTDHGFIKVRLEAQPLPNKHDESRSRVTLTVTDSGRGISKEYLRDRLFTPFAQEDPLTVGTGLGLSIVRQIITSMGGEIDVQSEKGHGTEIKVRMIMTHTPVSKESLEQSNAGMVKARGRRVGLVGFEARREDLDQKSRAPEHGDQLFLSSFHKLCTDWFNVHVHPVALPDLGAADVLLTTESGLEELKSRMNDGKDGKETFAEHGADIPPVIVLCRTASLAHSCLARDSEEGLPLVVEYISQP
ncbi:hypothetical protein LTR04_001198 [Oleoguttula sp. CCFEE 6159]|nr:hypothetical protein LTR04_001198 [Oleoguttula sp. CCFEE 6159]